MLPFKFACLIMSLRGRLRWIGMGVEWVESRFHIGLLMLWGCMRTAWNIHGKITSFEQSKNRAVCSKFYSLRMSVLQCVFFVFVEGTIWVEARIYAGPFCFDALEVSAVKKHVRVLNSLACRSLLYDVVARSTAGLTRRSPEHRRRDQEPSWAQ